MDFTDNQIKDLQETLKQAKKTAENVMNMKILTPEMEGNMSESQIKTMRKFENTINSSKEGSLKIEDLKNISIEIENTIRNGNN